MPLQNGANRSLNLLIAAISLLWASLASAMSEPSLLNARLGGKPSVVLQASKTSITYPCPPGARSISNSCSANVDLQVALTSVTKGFRKQAVLAYTVSGGRIVGEGSHVVWDLNGVSPGYYTATVEVRDNKRHRAASSVGVQIRNCHDCVHTHDNWCPPMVAICYDEVKAGTPVTCKVVIHPPSNRFKYEWSVRDSSGAEVSGFTSKGIFVQIPTNGLAGQTIYTTVEVKELDPSCSRTASSSTKVKP